MIYSEAISSGPVVLVEFYASWCPHCQRMMPVIAQLRDLMADSGVRIFQYDVDEHQQLSDENGIESYPTFLLYHNGKQAWRGSGEMTYEALTRQIMRVLRGQQ